MDELVDSFGKEIRRGFIGFSLIGFSGSGCAQHLLKAKVAYSAGSGFTLKNNVKCPGHSYKRGTPISRLIEGASSKGCCFSRMLTEKQFEKFPHEATALIFNKKDFEDICKRGKK